MMDLLRSMLIVTICLYLISCGGGGGSSAPPAPPGPENDFWTETAVRKVLHVFAYGGHASDAQITAWANIAPQTAIQEILTFDVVNEKLSPTVDNTALRGGTLETLQTFWSSDVDINNPMRIDRRTLFPTLYTNSDLTVGLNAGTLQNTWIETINKSGLNPFRQKAGLFLTNYHMAVSTHKVRPPLVRKLYDSTLDALAAGEPFQNVLALGATSAAVAMQYGHQWNVYDNTNFIFRGNDDFAREYHQLFFRILGVNEDQNYHENTTIENTAHALTGMQIDRDLDAYGGSSNTNDYWLDTIDFTDHPDPYTGMLYNTTNHHAVELEILHTPISGATAEEKIYALSQVAISEPESLDNLPVFIISYFADDNLNAEKTAAIRALWRSIVPKNLLIFLQKYAISPDFHREDTFKYRTAFSRNLNIFNLTTVDNEEAYKNSSNPRRFMSLQGVQTFAPAHDVFGGQTSLNAANNPNIFKEAYNQAVNNVWYTIKVSESYPNPADPTNPASNLTWEKDWALIIPKNDAGVHQVKEIGEWLWQRFIADGLKNYTALERAYVTGFLATGFDFGYIVDAGNPDVIFTTQQLSSEPLLSYLTANESGILALDSSDVAVRGEANRRVGMAINFINMTPFMFAMEGQ